MIRLHASIMAVPTCVAVGARFMEWPGITSVAMRVALISFIQLINYGADL